MTRSVILWTLAAVAGVVLVAGVTYAASGLSVADDRPLLRAARRGRGPRARRDGDAEPADDARPRRRARRAAARRAQARAERRAGPRAGERPRDPDRGADRRRHAPTAVPTIDDDDSGSDDSSGRGRGRGRGGDDSDDDD